MKSTLPTAPVALTPIALTLAVVFTVSSPKDVVALTPVVVAVMGIEATAVPKEMVALTPVTLMLALVMWSTSPMLPLRMLPLG